VEPERTSRGWTATRRGFLRLAGSGAALGALAQLPVAVARALPAGTGEPFFDPTGTEILTQVMERVVYSGVPGAPRVRDTGAVASVDALCRQLDPSISGLLPLALRLFEWGPLVFELSFTRFTRMSDAEKDASLRAWMTSRLELRRLAFLGVRNLCFVGYYSQDETWPLIGYQGPLLAPRAPEPA
jgi:hypothetical protein